MDNYFHSVTLDKDKCTGCTVCMHNCPTQAIRVVDGKAEIIKERCIDCGKCILVCPFKAKKAKTDPFKMINDYKYKIAVPSLSFFGQFPKVFTKNRILTALKSIGFDDVCDTSRYSEIISLSLKKQVESGNVEKPVISTYCPAVTRLIQLNNHELIKNISRLESPMEVAARDFRKKARELTGLDDKDIGVFYITQCPAKITSIKNPLGLGTSALDGAISTREVYPMMMKIIDKVEETENLELGGAGLLWSRLYGQCKLADIESHIAVDGIEEVKKILDMAELNNLITIDFLETYACRGACLGGPLNVENPFIARHKIDKYIKGRVIENVDKIETQDLLWDKEIPPKKILKLDDNIMVALEKMEKIEEYIKLLPGINCGACGSPTCRSLAEDVVLGRARLYDCVFLKEEER